MLDRELDFHEIKQMLRVGKEAMRTNHYVHMHTKPKDPKTAKTTQVTSAKSKDLQDGKRSRRKLDTHSELQIRSNYGDAKSLNARNILSSNDQISAQELNHMQIRNDQYSTKDRSSQNVVSSLQNSSIKDSSPRVGVSSKRVFSKPQAKTASDTLGANGWKITSNDD